MKKTILVLLVSIALLSSGCLKKTKDNQDINSDTNSTIACETMQCFEENFKNCQAASFIFFNKEDFWKIKYEIIKNDGNFCQIKTTVLENNEFPKWNNKSMICKYDNSLEFFNGAEYKIKIDTCQGELFKSMYPNIKKVTLRGILEMEKSFILNGVFMPEFDFYIRSQNQDPQTYLGKNMEIIGYTYDHPCGETEQCYNGQYLTDIESVKILDND